MSWNSVIVSASLYSASSRWRTMAVRLSVGTDDQVLCVDHVARSADDGANERSFNNAARSTNSANPSIPRNLLHDSNCVYFVSRVSRSFSGAVRWIPRWSWTKKRIIRHNSTGSISTAALRKPDNFSPRLNCSRQVGHWTLYRPMYLKFSFTVFAIDCTTLWNVPQCRFCTAASTLTLWRPLLPYS